MAYYLKITLESGNTDNDEPYQKTTFIQNYSDHTQQIKEMQGLFPSVANTIGTRMVEAGQAYVDLNTPQTSVDRVPPGQVR